MNKPIADSFEGEYLNDKKPIKKKCLKCGRYMKQLKDPITKTYTGHLWRCSCMSPDYKVSIG